MIPFTPPKWAVWALGAVVAIVLLAALWLTITSREEADDTRNIERGKVEQREAGQKAVLDQVEKANEAEAAINRGGDAEQYARCMRYAEPDTRANCDALRPVPD